MFTITQEIMHQIGLLPLAVMLVLVKTTKFKRGHWLIASALALSWIMDSLTVVFGGHSDVIMQAAKPIQLGLVLTALVVDWSVLTPMLGTLGLLAGAAALQGTNGYDLIVPVIGGSVICFYAWRKLSGLERDGLLVYFGVGAVAWAVFALARPTPGWRMSWYAFQATRLAGIALVTAALVQYARRPRMELIK